MLVQLSGLVLCLACGSWWLVECGAVDASKVVWWQCGVDKCGEFIELAILEANGISVSSKILTIPR